MGRRETAEIRAEAVLRRTEAENARAEAATSREETAILRQEAVHTRDEAAVARVERAQGREETALLRGEAVINREEAANTRAEVATLRGVALQKSSSDADNPVEGDVAVTPGESGPEKS